MNDVLSRLELAANTNPAEALKLLPELFRAVHEGLIVELPCKVGDTLYWRSLGGKRLDECIVREIDFTGRYTMIGINVFRDGICDKENLDFDGALPSSAIGTCLFLTREAAIKKLESEK